jgi:NhaA family Na+:H+ antiporter
MVRSKKRFKKGTPNKILHIIRPFDEFMQYEASGGIVLLLCVVIALVVTNSPIGQWYLSIWEIHIGVTIGAFSLTKPLLFWINDLLMAVFFFLIGLEIKREVLIGELSDPRVALAPIIAAAGGMIFPGLLYLSINPLGSQGSEAWAIPIATDIAVALGLLSIFGSKVPSSLKIFLATLAITDDIGGVLVIAMFYTTEIFIIPLTFGIFALFMMVMLNRLGIRKLLVYAVIGIFVWLQFLFSGVHPTVAGILIALTIPATTKIDYLEFVSISSGLVNRCQDSLTEGIEQIDFKRFQDTSDTLRIACRDVETPLQLAEHSLAKWVAFVIIPIFAFANAGITIFELSIDAILNPVSMGIVVGLVVGKPLGIICFTWLSIRLGIIRLPEGVDWDTMVGVACLAGIGFTISIFISSLALTGSALAGAKGAILIASFISGFIGVAILRISLNRLYESTKPYIITDLDPRNIIHCDTSADKSDKELQ